MKKIKEIIRKMAAYFVTAYAKRAFRDAIKVAESWHGVNGERYYVICDPSDESRLVSITEKDYLDARHRFGLTSKEYPLSYLKKTSWYYTLNKNGKDPITEDEIEVRRLAFIRYSLERAKLI